MLAKLVATLPAKIAAAALGGALIVGGGATALAAGNLHGAAHHAAHGSSRGGNTAPAQGKHAHTTALDGTLKAYDAGAGTITVDGKKADAGDEHGAGGATGATSTFTIAVNANTRVNGRHAKTLADLAKAIGSKVQVQALDDGKGNLTAWKVTVGDKAGDQGQDQQGAHFEGTVGTVDTAASTFTLQPAQGNALTIHTSPQTRFEGVQGLADLKPGMRAEVAGAAQPDGSVAATKVHAKGADQGDKGQHEAELEGTVTSVDTGAQTFVLHTEDGHDMTVHASPQTHFHGKVHGLADLKPGMRAEVAGAAQPDGSVNATKVDAEGQGDHGNGRGQDEGQDD